MKPQRPSSARIAHPSARTYRAHDEHAAMVNTEADKDRQLRLVSELFIEHWITLKRHARNLSLTRADRAVDAEAFCAAAMHCIALAVRDEPAVATVVYSAVSKEQPDAVDMDKLHRVCKSHLKTDAKWKVRFQADGILDNAMQRATVGVTRNTNEYRKQYDGVPYAVTGDPECVNKLQKSYLMRRCKQFQRHLLSFQTSPNSGRISIPDFHKAINGIERYGCSDVDFAHLRKVLDPKNTGTVSIQEFIDRFAFDFLKSKSMRNALGADNNDGKRTVFEWPGGRSQVEDGHIKKKTMTDEILRVAAESGERLSRQLKPIPRTHSMRLRERTGKQARQFQIEREELERGCLAPQSPRAPFPPPTPEDAVRHPKRWGARGDPEEVLRQSQQAMRNELKPLAQVLKETEQYRVRYAGPIQFSGVTLGNVGVPRRPQSAR